MNKHINYLIILRIWAAIILAACCYWIFSDLEIEFGPKIYLPLIYFYSTELYITKKMTVLIVPLLMNIALWVPCYWSYIFIRLVLYAERIATILWTAFFVAFGTLSIVFIARGSIVDFIFVSGVCMAFNEALYQNFITERYKERFSASTKTDEEIQYLVSQLVMVFFVIVLFFLMGEHIVQSHLPTKLSANYREVETRSSIKLVKENTVEDIPFSQAWRPKLSRDEKMLLVKIPSYEDKSKNIFVIDLASMQAINILPGSNSNKKNFNYHDYEFTPDNKYVVVGNRILDNPKIKFSVLDIATSEVDTRFHDPQGLLEKSPWNIYDVALISFDPSGDYFAVVGEVKHPEYYLEIWDYRQGTLISVEKINSNIEGLTWVSDRKCLFLYYYSIDDEANRITKGTEFLEQREILEDGSVLTTSKEKITADIKVKDWSRKRRNFIENDGKYLAILDTSYKNNIKVWEVNSEKKIFSLDSDNEIKGMLFHPDGKQLMVLEILKDKKTRITFWDMATGEKKERLFLSSPILWNTARLIDNASKILLIYDAVNIISLEK